MWGNSMLPVNNVHILASSIFFEEVAVPLALLYATDRVRLR